MNELQGSIIGFFVSLCLFVINSISQGGVKGRNKRWYNYYLRAIANPLGLGPERLSFKISWGGLALPVTTSQRFAFLGGNPIFMGGMGILIGYLLTYSKNDDDDKNVPSDKKLNVPNIIGIILTILLILMFIIGLTADYR